MNINFFEKLLAGVYGVDPLIAEKWAQSAPFLAAEKLDTRQYAAYRVLMDNQHLFDVQVLADGKFEMVATQATHDISRNTVSKILWSELGYTYVRGAALLVSVTIKKLLKLLRANAGCQVPQTAMGIRRISMSTREVLDHPDAQSRNPFRDTRVAVDLLVPSYEDPMHRFKQLRGEMLLKVKRKSISINLPELLCDSNLDDAVFRFYGKEYKKEDFLDDFTLLILSGNLDTTQRSMLAVLSTECRQRLEQLTGCVLPTKQVASASGG